MPIDEFIIHVFCLVDDFIKEEISSTPLRKRGFSSNLTDSEVITMRLVGEYLGFGDEKPIWEYFKRHWVEWFPKLGCRTTFTVRLDLATAEARMIGMHRKKGGL